MGRAGAPRSVQHSTAVEYQLPIEPPPHAIHGTGFTSQWEVVDAGRDYCELRTDLPWAVRRHRSSAPQLDEHGLTCMLSVYAAQQAMPAVLGWHPCFRKPLQADLEFGRMYVRDDDYIADARPGRRRTPHPWDDCFIDPLGPLRLHYPGLTRHRRQRLRPLGRVRRARRRHLRRTAERTARRVHHRRRRPGWNRANCCSAA